MKVLLISNKLYHYRIEVYNYFRNEFLKQNIDFEVLVDEAQECNVQIRFPLHIQDRTYASYKKRIHQIGPEIVIFFLHLKDTAIFPLFWYCRRKGIRTIYWGHGINLWKPENTFKNYFFRYFHKKSDAIILYSPDQLKYIDPRFHSKTHIALNTINFHSFPSIKASKSELRKKYGLNFKTIVLFCGRVTPGKQLDILVDIFARSNDPWLGLLIVGGGLSGELKAKVDSHDNMVYLGAVYDPLPVNELHKLSDLCCIPGKCGLSINLAMYWSLPVLTTDVNHAPEIYYLKNGVNGFIASDRDNLAKKITLLANDKRLCQRFSEDARKIITEEGDISNMFNGFKEAVEYVMQPGIRTTLPEYK